MDSIFTRHIPIKQSQANFAKTNLVLGSTPVRNTGWVLGLKMGWRNDDMGEARDQILPKDRLIELG